MQQTTLTLATAFAVGSLAFAQKVDNSAPTKGMEQPGHYGFGASLAAGGSNDCSAAAASNTLVGTGTFPISTLGATTGVAPAQPQTPSTIKNDVWFYWVASTTGTARLETCGGAGGIDTKAAAWLANNGTSCPSGTNLAYNDDACALESRISWSVTAGTAYFIQLGAFTEGVTYSGTFTLNVLTPPTNDNCATSNAVTGDGPHAFDTTLATTGTEGQSELICGANTGIGRDIWFTWTASASGTRGVSTLGTTALDTKIAVYPAGGCPTAGTALACNDDTNGAQSLATFTAVAGTTYLIQLGQDPTNVTAGGTGTFSIIDPTPPSNDNCAQAAAISGAGPFSYNTTFSTTSPEGQAEALCLFFGQTAITRDVWFVWTASTSGPVTVANCGQFTSTATDTKIAVYDGAGCPAAAAIACNDDAGATLCATQNLSSNVTFNAVCGQSYTIQVGCYGAAGANIVGTFSVTESGSPCIAGTAYCFGDGTGGACPCGNLGTAGNGCANSINANGANLTGSGNASISGDSLSLTGSGMPNSNALYFQGTTQIAAAFGDGLRCAGGTVVRLGTKLNVAGSSTYPVAGDLSVSVRGAVTVPGVRNYQAWYRNAAAFCTASTFNLTNGYSVTWAP